MKAVSPSVVMVVVARSILLSLVLTGLASASVLGDTAAQMAPGTWVKMPQNDSLDSMVHQGQIVYFSNSGTWAPGQQKVMWMGSPGTCCSDNPIYKLITYDVLSDKWDIRSSPYGGTGHAYDGMAVDPVTSMFYFNHWQDKDLKTWDGQNWGSLPDYPGTSSATNSMVWFPDINNGRGGLLLVRGGGRLHWYDVDSRQWTDIPNNGGWGGHSFAEYNPVEKVVWLGSGVNYERQHYKLDAQFNLTRLQDGPFSMKTNKLKHSLDPVSGLYIIRKMDTNDWYEYDIRADRWTLLSMPGKPSKASWHVPIPEHGVILWYSSDSGRSAYLYKHSPSERDNIAPAKPTDLAVD